MVAERRSVNSHDGPDGRLADAEGTRPAEPQNGH